MTIKLNPCESSQIHAHGYDPVTKTLAIQFKSKGGPGNIYEYDSVPQEVYDAFCKCDSFGRFFGEHIKNKPYVYRKIIPDAPATDHPAGEPARTG